MEYLNIKLMLPIYLLVAFLLLFNINISKKKTDIYITKYLFLLKLKRRDYIDKSSMDIILIS